MAAILLGHLIGGLMMFAAGMIGAKERKSAMETVKMSFGRERKPSVCCLKCVTACRVDRNYDL